MTVEMFQPVGVNEQTGALIVLEVPTPEQQSAQELVAIFDRHMEIVADATGAPPPYRGAVLAGYFVPYRVMFPDGTSQDLGQEPELPYEEQQPVANGRHQAPQSEMASPLQVQVTGG